MPLQVPEDIVLVGKLASQVERNLRAVPRAVLAPSLAAVIVTTIRRLTGEPPLPRRSTRATN